MSTWSDVSDEELAARVVAGERVAFEAIYARYALALLRYAGAKVNTREDAEEIVQDVFVSLWARREKLDRVISLQAYLYRSVTYGVLNYYRAHRVRREYAEQFTLFLVGEDNTIEKELDLSELQSVIQKKLGDLPERCQEAFRLSRFENLTIPAIAERMNISTFTVKNYITAALKHLRLALQQANN